MTDTTLQQKIRAAYGRGAHDARRAMEKEADMTPAKLAQAEQAVNGIAQKVLDATPKQEPWPLSKIIAELKRTGCNIGADVALGCLSTMTRAGLVKELAPRTFMRVTAKERPAAELVVVVAKPSKQAKPPQEPDLEPVATAIQPEPAATRGDTLAKLADLSAGVRAMAAQFTALAAAIDDVAIEVEERIAAVDAGNQQLAQLRALLKGIGI